MTPEEKIIYYVREGLIEKHGEDYLELSEREQTLIICEELQKHFERFKNGN